MTHPKSSRPRLIVVDAMSLVHRAFHAVPASFATTRGEPTNAVYGFVNMLLRVVDQLKPQYGVVAFDGPGRTFRDDHFKDYKANRVATPEELVVQFDRVRQVVDALGLPAYQVEGFEADDILGFMAREGAEQGLEVILITGDRDAYQLINENVRVLTSNPRTGEPVIFDDAKVAERWAGLKPSQIVDLKALQGDTSDNIPGVPGIGEKTAIELLRDFGSLDNILSHVDELPLRSRKALASEENRNLALLSRQLATIVSDLPIELDLEQARLWRADPEKVRELFIELEFRSLLNRMPFASGAGAPVHGEPHSRQLGLFGGDSAIAPATAAVGDAGEARELLARFQDREAGVFGIVEETIEGPVLNGLAVAVDTQSCWYFPMRAPHADPAAGVLSVLKAWLEDPSKPKLTHDAKPLLRALRLQGIRAAGFDFDTHIAAFLLNLGQQDTIDAIALARLQVELEPRESDLPRGRGIAGLDPAEIPAAAGARAVAVVAVAQELRAELERLELLDLFRRVEMPLVPVLAQIEEAGLKVDAGLLKEMGVLLAGEVEELTKQIFLDVGHEFNVDSPKQLGDVLFDELKLPSGKKTKTGFSTAKNVLDELRGAHPAVERVLEYRELSKLKSTYVDALPGLVNPRTGRIHTSLSQTVAATGRLSSSNPNLQNIPIRDERGRQIRKAFVAEGAGWLLLAADYSQIELRVLAHICNDESMLRAFADDEDIHTATAAQMFDVALEQVTPRMRRVAKTTNFGIIYGITDMGLSMRTDLSRQEAGQLIESYFRKYPAIRDYMDATIAQAYKQGYVSTLLNRRRYLPELKSRIYAHRQAAERMAINMPIQGTAAEIMKIAMIDMTRELDQSGLRARMILQVHDELLLELPEEEQSKVAELARSVMGSAFELKVPLKVDISAGRNWGEMKPA